MLLGVSLIGAGAALPFSRSWVGVFAGALVLSFLAILCFFVWFASSYPSD
jgi:hypothetical protein